MFERYTEKARRVVFFARYEAGQFGAPAIDAEHLLLGLLREDKALANRFFLKAHLTLDGVRRDIEARTVRRERTTVAMDLPLSPEAKRILVHAAEEAERMNLRAIGTEHLLLALLREENTLAARILYEHGLRPQAIREEILRTLSPAPATTPTSGNKKESSGIAEYSRDLTDLAARRMLDPLIGRQSEIERVIQILCRRNKNNPLLIGEPGVGKTAIVEGLAERIVNGDVPRFLADKRIVALDLSLVVAGTKYRGQFEERLKNIMRELAESKNIIVFIDEIHTLVGAGSAEGSLDAANIMKPALSRGEIQCIGATTPADFRRSIEKDRSLERRFQSVPVVPPTEEEALSILMGLKEKYEDFHGVIYTAEALSAAVHQSNRYIVDRFLPDKAIDVIDEAGTQVKLRAAQQSAPAPVTTPAPRRTSYFTSFGSEVPPSLETLPPPLSTPVVTRADIEEVISRWTGIPVSALKEDEVQKLLRLEDELHRRVISQDRAISALARAIRRSRAGVRSPKRPVGSFLFLGPTGVGKTESARTLAELLFGSERALIRFDMSEYMEKHSVAKLIGSPPGYVGHEEGGQLTEQVRRHPYSVLLFDEIEKAHPDLFNLLLQVLEDGQLTDSLGTTVNFKNCIIILTSNIGARHIQKRGRLGFHPGSVPDDEAAVMNAVRQTFSPEFINRLDDIIIFEPLVEADLEAIVALLLAHLNETLSFRGLSLSATPEVLAWIVQQTAHERQYGARPLRRAIQRFIEDPLSDAVIRGDFKDATHIEVFIENGQIQFRALTPEPTEALATS
ncbi:ATP-dependent Clp protease ATP-binding subunit [Chloracidobacterium thermophilum]|jgi:ATP-dependent Clp protease ATP-binding subunit ClpC|uniref:ATPases with chaperone activity, ATP-binding subunit n=1 Tax=Chloracidobacterium thermophilum (strain B) TaxID=981222 RepID=G2LHI6_CHLTF|nr:ATP-dependent Clp protease ATP-binding subunit [Chloracidobacterium thermophilum]AEP12650.1 ATPases with chaperone activity, ATP-binding subunit [Chloracidobacterium thermophilum B]QUV78392.1 ATP-dependent Clp protease ATP-binding subunit [Chloracidobacterium thermophilum]